MAVHTAVPPRAARTPRTARLSASVPPLVNTMSPGAAPTSSASDRAGLVEGRATRPCQRVGAGRVAKARVERGRHRRARLGPQRRAGRVVEVVPGRGRHPVSSSSGAAVRGRVRTGRGAAGSGGRSTGPGTTAAGRREAGVRAWAGAGVGAAVEEGAGPAPAGGGGGGYPAARGDGAAAVGGRGRSRWTRGSDDRRRRVASLIGGRHRERRNCSGWTPGGGRWCIASATGPAMRMAMATWASVVSSCTRRRKDRINPNWASVTLDTSRFWA